MLLMVSLVVFAELFSVCALLLMDQDTNTNTLMTKNHVAYKWMLIVVKADTSLCAVVPVCVW